jgi:MATE family multidrug resistance protein
MKANSASTRELMRIAWPVLVAQLAMMANSVIDTAMAGRLTAVDLAAVGIAASIMVTVLMSLLSILLALPPMIAHHYGAGRQEDIGRELHQGLWVAMLLGVIAILLLRHPGPLIAISDLQPAVEAKVRAYLDAASWGVPGVVALRLFIGMSIGIGRPRPVMAFNLLSLLLKVPLNAIFMFGLLGAPAMGGPGCAVATAIDAWLIAGLAWYWCLNNRDYSGFRLSARLSGPDGKVIMALFKLGVPIGMTFVADVTAFTFMALFIARLGPVVSAAHQIAANLAALAFMFPLAIGNATAVLAGQAIGAGQPQRARSASLRGIRIGFSLAVAMSMLIWFCAPQIAALYTSSTKVQSVAVPLIMLVGIYHLADAIQSVSVNALRGYKKSVVPMMIYTLSLWGLGLGGGYILGLTDWLGEPRGAAGFWEAAIASLWLVAILMLAYLNSASRKERDRNPQDSCRR